MESMTEARTQTDKRIDDLRSDTRAGFERLEAEMHTGSERLETEMRTGFRRIETDTRANFERVDGDIRELRADNRLLRSQMDAKFDVVQESFTEIRKLMIVFFASTLGSIIAAAVVAVLLHS